MADKKEYEAKINITADAEGVKPGVDQAVKDMKKLHTATIKSATTELKTNKENQKINTQQTRERRKNTPRDIQDLRTKNKLIAEENKLIRARIKATKDQGRIDEQKRRRTFTGGFRAGFGSRLGIDDSRDARPMRARIGGAMGGALGGGLLSLGGIGLSALTRLLSMPIQAIGQQYETYQQYGKGLSRLSGYAGAGATKEDVDKLRSGIGQQLGFSPEEVISTVGSVARATGSYKGTGTALGLSRLVGMGTEEVSGMYGAFRQAGNKDFTSGGDAFKQIVKAMSLGIYTGLEKARMPEFLQGVTELTTAGAAREAGDVSSTNYARLLATLGATKSSGMQGARGVAVAKALEEGFQAPGGGEEGQAMMLAAMGFGGGASYYEAKRAQQRGTAGDPNFVKKSMQFVNRAYGGPGEEANLAIEAMLGGRLSLEQIEKVQAAMASGKSQKEIDAMIKEAGATELDVLKEIRDLFKGGDSRNDQLLKVAKESSQTENTSIDIAAQYAEALQQMQVELQKFMKDTAPAIAKVLNSLANLLVDMRPVLQDVAEAVSAVTAYLPHTGIGGSTASGEKRRGTRGVDPEDAHVSSTVDLASELMNRDSTLTTQEAYRQAQQIEQNRAADAAGARTIYPSTTGGSDFSVSSREQRGIEQAEILARARGFGTLPEHQVDNRVDTNEELRMLFSYITAQGMNVPAEFTALVARYGGEGAP